MAVEDGRGWDFLNWLGHDTSACIFHRLDDPADLARAAAVSRSWRQFVIANEFCKSVCLRICPEDYSNLCGALVSSKPSVNCILDCIGASSTDRFLAERMENTLDPREMVDYRPSYWSSGGQNDPDVPESLTYRLHSDLCIVDEIRIRPYQVSFYYGEQPIFSSKMVRFRFGYSKLYTGLDWGGNQRVIADEKYVWTYTSPDFPMRQVQAHESAKPNRLMRTCKACEQPAEPAWPHQPQAGASNTAWHPPSSTPDLNSAFALRWNNRSASLGLPCCVYPSIMMFHFQHMKSFGKPSNRLRASTKMRPLLPLQAGREAKENRRRRGCARSGGGPGTACRRAGEECEWRGEVEVAGGVRVNGAMAELAYHIAASGPLAVVENVLQSFKLPHPVLCIGGVLKIELLGRTQKAIDDMYYICVCHAQVMGRSLSPVFMVDISDSADYTILKYLPSARN
nr:unnamed protein product [Digitaria exilis]